MLGVSLVLNIYGQYSITSTFSQKEAMSLVPNYFTLTTVEISGSCLIIRQLLLVYLRCDLLVTKIE